MKFGLTPDAIESIQRVLSQHPKIQEAIIFGSRALNRAHSRSDVDLALRGDLQSLDAERIALELEDLPLPVHFDVLTLNSIRHLELCEHISRVGESLYQRADLRTP